MRPYQAEARYPLQVQVELEHNRIEHWGAVGGLRMPGLDSRDSMKTATEAGLDSKSKVSMTTAASIVVADMIGVGVFTSLGFQVASIPSPFAIVVLWTVGGLVALCGAVSYAELAAMFPRSSGEYNYLSRVYHPIAGLLAGWLSATVGFAAPVALAAMALGSYGRAIWPGVPPLALGMAVIWIVSLVALRGLRQSGTFQTVGTGVKIGLIVAFLVAGLAFSTAQPITFMPRSTDIGHLSSAAFALSLVFVMYAYSGWNAATYIVGEMVDPQRNVPRALLLGTAFVTVLYVALNALFLYTTPMDQLAGQLDVAVVAGKHMFGDMGGRLVGGLICIGLVSSISAMMWIGPRVIAVMGEDIQILRVFAQRTENGVPAAAIVFQLLVANLLLLTQSFEAILDMIQFALIASSFATVAGVIVMRIRRPDLPRPYRAWGYPVTPLIFMAVAAFMMYHLLTERPLQSAAGLLVTGSGLVVYYLSRKSSAALPVSSN